MENEVNMLNLGYLLIFPVSVSVDYQYKTLATSLTAFAHRLYYWQVSISKPRAMMAPSMGFLEYRQSAFMIRLKASAIMRCRRAHQPACSAICVAKSSRVVAQPVFVSRNYSHELHLGIAWLTTFEGLSPFWLGSGKMPHAPPSWSWPPMPAFAAAAAEYAWWSCTAKVPPPPAM